ncbi:MAG: hypothetical protein IJY28_10705 [Clostridia bacterium]|nr:hypothetical protein [Clostridia bacterium]
MDSLFEILIEFFGELYMELMLLVVPEKRGSKTLRCIAGVLSIVEVFGIILLAAWGISLIADDHNLQGILPIAIAVIISLVQIIAGIRLYNRNH